MQVQKGARRLEVDLGLVIDALVGLVAVPIQHVIAAAQHDLGAQRPLRLKPQARRADLGADGEPAPFVGLGLGLGLNRTRDQAGGDGQRHQAKTRGHDAVSRNLADESTRPS